MITEKQIITQEAGVSWTDITHTVRYYGPYCLCVTSTGRIIAGSNTDFGTGGIWYSDDNGANWVQSNKTDGNWRALCITSTGRIIAGNYYKGIWYSDDNGITWTPSNKTDMTDGDEYCGLCVTPTGRIIAAIGYPYYSDDNGINWVRVTDTNITGYVTGFLGWRALCVTSTGRIIVGGTSNSGSLEGIWYSDDSGVTWAQSNKTDGAWRALCVTPTGRIIAANTNSHGIWYSDDNGETWIQSDITVGWWYSLCVTPTGRIITSDSSTTLKYSDPVTEIQKSYTSKPLTGAQAKELVQQCKAYVQGLKNS